MDNLVSENYVWNVIHDFHKKEGLLAHQKESFDYFISNGIDNIIQESDVVVEQPDLKYIAKFKNAYVPSPTIIDEDRKIKVLYPSEALIRDLNYESTIYVDIDEIFKTEGEKTEIISHKRVELAKMPIMLLSEKCNLSSLTENERIQKNECFHDNGGYFIIKGKERVLVGQIRGIYNQPVVILQKPGDKYKYICDVRSMSEETGHSVLLQCKIGIDDRTLVFSLPNIKDNIPVGIVFKALGFIEEKDIINLIGNKNKEVEKYLKYIIRDSFHITTQKDALKYIGQFAMHIIKDENREKYALQIVENELLPHMGITATIKEKAIYLGFIVSKLLNTHTGLRKEDDRDNYINKRVEMAGILCHDLFRTLFKRYIKNVQLQLEKKKQRPDILSVMNRMSSITVGLKHSFCVPAGTNVSMSNGLSYPIEKLSEFENGYEKVLGFNGTGVVSTNHGGLVNQGIKDTIKLTFEDGRVLSCTPDHKILVLNKDKTTSWVEAIKIPINSRIVIGLDNPLDNIEEDLNNNWELVTKYETLNNLEKQIWKVSSKEERNKTLAFMRILGYIICDGHLPLIKKNQGVIYFGTLFDVECFINDYKLVMGTDENPKINESYTDKWGATYVIRISNKLSNMLRNIDGVITGKKVTNIRNIPIFLLEENCPKSVIREFLGGLFGGDGHSPRLDIRKGRRTCIDSVKFSWTTQQINIDMLKKVFDNIKFLLEKVNVKNTYINGPYVTSSGPKDRLYYRMNLASNTDFHKYVGFRYCIHKTYKLNIVSSYWRMQEEIKRQHSFIINNVNKIKEENKKITIKEALDISRKELINREYILNNYYSLSSEKDILKRRENGRSIELKYLQEKFGVSDVKDFINDMGALYMFEGEYTSQRCSVELPYFSLKLMDIRNDKAQIVYDITNVKICKSFFAAGIAVSNSTGNWGVQKNNYIRTGVSQVLARMNYGSTLSHLRRCVIPIGKEGKNAKIRQTHPSQIMYLCPNETPEGQSIGIVLNLALMTKVSIKIPTVVVKEIIESCYYFNFIEDIELEENNIYPKIFVNGILLGATKEPENFINELKEYHKNNLLDKSISFTFDKEENEIKIFSDEGRLLRPVFTINEENRLNINENVKVDWKMLVEEGYIKYIDNCEVENSVIAMDQTDLNKFKCDYCEIHPSMMMGVMSNAIPFPDHSQSPRNIYQSSMGKQAIGLYATSFQHRSDTITHVLNYVQRPLVSTLPSQFMGFNDMPMGMNLIVAIMTYGGFNQEDAVILNKGSVDRGLFHTTSYRTLMTEEKKQGSNNFETICIPPIDKRKKNANYSFLDENGIVKKRVNGKCVYVEKGDVIIGKTLTKTNKSSLEEEVCDVSYVIKSGEEGFIDRIFDTITPNGYKMVKVVIRNNKIPEIGDKLASRAAQKGTIGMIYAQEDMPFTPDGITPDLILNSHAIPSRMTINVLLETLLGKSCLLEGTFGDATPFTSNSVNIAEKLCERLQNNGYEKHGWEELINGFTGEPLKAKVYFGPTYYQRLKHMVSDKIHCIKISPDTSVLTLNGWKTAYELTMNDYIATLKDGKLVYEKPKDIIIYPDYEGPMYYIKNQAIDLAVTGNHRMWVSKPIGKKRVWQEYNFARADEIIGKYVKYKKDAIWEKEDYQFILPSVIKFYTPTLNINIKEKIVDMNSWLMFFGIWYAEGWASGQDTCGCIHISINKQRVKDALYLALEILGYEFSINKEDKLSLYDYQLYRYMKPLSVGAPNKELPEWVFELSKEQTRILIKGMLLGDGSSNKNSGCEFYYTSSIKLADQFQQLCLHAGWAGIISTHIKAGENHVKINERDIINNYDILRISVITKRLNPSVNHGHVHKQKVQEEKYIEKEKCPVFCLQVPSEVFYIRTSGKACWTGNSRSNGDVTLLTRQPLDHPLYLFLLSTHYN